MALVSVNLPISIRYIGTIMAIFHLYFNIILTSGNAAFSYCTLLTSVNIPTGVTFIGTITFSGCKSLTSISIPTSVITIGSIITSITTTYNTVTIIKVKEPLVAAMP